MFASVHSGSQTVWSSKGNVGFGGECASETISRQGLRRRFGRGQNGEGFEEFSKPKRSRLRRLFLVCVCLSFSRRGLGVELGLSWSKKIGDGNDLGGVLLLQHGRSMQTDASVFGFVLFFIYNGLYLFTDSG